jgi:hypothetical protein
VAAAILDLFWRLPDTAVKYLETRGSHTVGALFVGGGGRRGARGGARAQGPAALGGGRGTGTPQGVAGGGCGGGARHRACAQGEPLAQ